MTTPSGEDGFDTQPARFGISPNPLSGDTPAALVGRTQEFIEQKLKERYVAGGPSIWALNPGSPLTVANNVLNAVFKAILGALDPHNLPTPEQVWQTITDVFLAPLNWLHNIPIGAITASTPNMLADFITADSLVGDTTWVFDSAVKPSGGAGSARTTFDGTVHELISERILLDVGRKVDASVKIKYSGVTAPTGSPIRLSWIGWNGDDEVAGGDFAVHQPSGAALDWTTLSGSLTRLESDPWDRVSIVLKTTAGAAGGTVWFAAARGTKPDKLPKNLVDGLESALAAAGQTIRDAICNALGLGGTGHTDADVIHALTNIPQAAVDGLTDLAGNVTGFFNGVYKALTGNDGSGSYVDPVDQLQYLVDTVSGHSQAISELQAANNGEGNGGLAFTDNFSVAVTGGPPPGWTARSTNGNTTYVDTHEGKAQWYNSGNNNPVVMWQRTDAATAKTLTQYQRIVATATTPTAGTNAQNRVYGRMSPDGTHYVVGYITNSTVYLAYAAGGAETVFDSGPMPNKVSFATGRQLVLECGTNEGANEYALMMGEVNLVQHLDSAHAATDATNFAARGLSEQPLGWAVGWKPGFNNFSQWQRPASLSSVSVSDNIPVDIQGHGFRVYRETTSASAAFAVSTTRLAQFYDTIDYISPGSAWGSTGYTIPKSGMWSFTWRNLKAGTTNFTAMTLGLTINGFSKTIGGSWRDTTTVQDTVQFYCKKGDVVDIYVSILVGTANMIGDSAGISSYFSGALMSA